MDLGLWTLDIIRSKMFKKIIFVFIACTAAFRLFYINTFPLLGDEAYYWQWSRHLAPGYYEQGPMVALVIWLFTLFNKISTVFTIRLGAVALSTATLYVTYLIYKKLRPLERDIKWNLLNMLFMSASVIYSVGAVLMMHDTVMIFFFALFVLQMLYVIDSPSNNMHWAHSGLLLGLAVISKYTAAPAWLAVILFAVFSGGIGNKIRLKSLFYFTLFFILALSPVIYWNLANDFATAKYLFIRGGSGGGFTLKYFGELLGSQAGLISPVLFFVFFPAAAAALKGKKNGPEFFLGVLFLTCLLPLLLLSFKSRVEANWPAFAFYPAFFLATLYLSKLKNTKAARAVTAAALAIGFCAVIFLHLQVALNLFPLPEKSNPVLKSAGYKELAQKVHGVYNQVKDNGPLFFSTRHYQAASLLAFYLPGQPEVYALIPHESRKNYRFWDGYKKCGCCNSIFVWSEPWETAEIGPFFTRGAEVARIEVQKSPVSKAEFGVNFMECYKAEK